MTVATGTSKIPVPAFWIGRAYPFYHAEISGHRLVKGLEAKKVPLYYTAFNLAEHLEYSTHVAVGGDTVRVFAVVGQFYFHGVAASRFPLSALQEIMDEDAVGDIKIKYLYTGQERTHKKLTISILHHFKTCLMAGLDPIRIKCSISIFMFRVFCNVQRVFFAIYTVTAFHPFQIIASHA